MNITKSRVQIVGPSGNVTVSKTSAGSPLSISANPASTASGKNARSASARVDWKLGGNRTAFVTCFYIDE